MAPPGVTCARVLQVLVPGPLFSFSACPGAVGVLHIKGHLLLVVLILPRRLDLGFSPHACQREQGSSRQARGSPVGGGTLGPDTRHPGKASSGLVGTGLGAPAHALALWLLLFSPVVGRVAAGSGMGPATLPMLTHCPASAGPQEKRVGPPCVHPQSLWHGVAWPSPAWQAQAEPRWGMLAQTGEEEAGRIPRHSAGLWEFISFHGALPSGGLSFKPWSQHQASGGFLRFEKRLEWLHFLCPHVLFWSSPRPSFFLVGRTHVFWVSTFWPTNYGSLGLG